MQRQEYLVLHCAHARVALLPLTHSDAKESLLNMADVVWLLIAMQKQGDRERGRRERGREGEREREREEMCACVCVRIHIHMCVFERERP